MKYQCAINHKSWKQHPQCRTLLRALLWEKAKTALQQVIVQCRAYAICYPLLIQSSPEWKCIRESVCNFFCWHVAAASLYGSPPRPQSPHSSRLLGMLTSCCESKSCHGKSWANRGQGAHRNSWAISGTQSWSKKSSSKNSPGVFMASSSWTGNSSG